MQTLTIGAIVLALTATGAARIATAASADGPASAAACAVLPRPTLHIRLVVEPDVPQDLREQVESAVATVWRGEGLAIEWLPSTPPGRIDPRTSFWLRIVARHIGSASRGAEPVLGIVRFLGGLPHHDVLVSWAAARDWARDQRNRQFESQFRGARNVDSLRFGGFEALARRALGYAAAHEVGHFVLGTKSHDGAGLMRHDLVPRVVAAVEDRDLILSDKSRRRLRDRLALRNTCAAGAADASSPQTNGGVK